MLYRHHIMYTNPELSSRFVVYDKYHIGTEERVDLFKLPKVINMDRIVYQKVNVFTGKYIDGTTRVYQIGISKKGNILI